MLPRQGAPGTIRCIKAPFRVWVSALDLSVGAWGWCVLRDRAPGTPGAARVSVDLIALWWVGWLCAGCGGGLVLGVCGALLSG